MKLTQEFVVREIAGDYILIPVVGIDDKFQGIITLNETGVFIWEKIVAGQEQAEIVAELTDTYEVEQTQAQRSVANFCDHLVELGILEV